MLEFPIKKNVICDSRWGSVFDGEGFTSAERKAYRGASQKTSLRCANPIVQINGARPDAMDATAHECQKLKPLVIKGWFFTCCHSLRNNIIPDSLPKEGCHHLPAESLGTGRRHVWHPAGGKTSLWKRRGQQQSTAQPPRSKALCYCSVVQPTQHCGRQVIFK